MKPNELQFAIAADGTITTIYDDGMASFLETGHAKVTRASHVEPYPAGGWIADMAPSNGPVLGPFRLREEALAAERRWLEARLFQ